MKPFREERGYSLVEILVVMLVLSVVTTTFYSVLFASKKAGDRALSGAKVSQTARLGFNRMVRDTREGDGLQAIDTNIADDNKVSFTVKVDFDSNGLITQPGPNTSGDLELLTYAYDRVTKTVTLNGETLMTNVQCITPACDVFSYSSNQLQYDWDANGLVTLTEIDQAGCSVHGSLSVGNCNAPDFALELPLVSNVDFALKVQEGSTVDTLYAQAQMRNVR